MAVISAARMTQWPCLASVLAVSFDLGLHLFRMLPTATRTVSSRQILIAFSIAPLAGVRMRYPFIRTEYTRMTMTLFLHLAFSTQSSSFGTYSDERAPTNIYGHEGKGGTPNKHTDNKTSQRFREMAGKLFARRNSLLQKSQAEYKLGCNLEAKVLSDQAKLVHEEAEYFNSLAAKTTFWQNNKESESDEIDLHGLYVKEAVVFLRHRLHSHVKSGESPLKIIVGKGKNSHNRTGRLRPAIEHELQEARLHYWIDKTNEGIIVVDVPNRLHNYWT